MRKLVSLILTLYAAGCYAQPLNGLVWHDPLTVADLTYGNLHPRIALDHEYKPLVLWGDNTGRVFLSKWTGREFTEPVRVNPPGKQAFTESWAGPEIASYGDTVYVAYKEMPEETSHIYIRHSYDAGKHFSIETQVDDSDGLISRFPTVAVDPYGNPLVAYMKYDAGFLNPRYVVAKSKDLGESFAGEALVTDYSGGKISDCCPATVVESGNATVILYRDNHQDYRNIWAGVSHNTGVSFDKGVQIEYTDWRTRECPANPPHGVIIGDTLYSVFASGTGDSSLVYLSKLSLSSMSATAAPLTGKFPGLTSQNFPRIANAGNAAAIVWQQSIGVQTEVCMLFTNEITTGVPAKYEVVAHGEFENLDVAIGGSHVFVVYQDDSSRNILCRIAHYEETQTNRLLAENTTVALKRASNGKSFSVDLKDLSYCLMVDKDGKEFEMDMKCRGSVCKINTEDLDPGMYVVRLFCKDEKVYTYKYEVKEIKEKEEKDRN